MVNSNPNPRFESPHLAAWQPKSSDGMVQLAMVLTNSTTTRRLWQSAVSLFSPLAEKIPPLAFVAHLTEALPDKTKDPEGAQRYEQQIETQMLNLPLTRQLKADPQYQMVRAWETVLKEKETSGKRRGEGLTAQTLHVPGGISTQPVVFTDPKARKSVAIVHVGRRLTGFPMLIHGGVLAALMDEALGRVAFLGLGSPAVTANLKLDYTAVTIAHQFIVLRTQCNDVNLDKKKACVTGTIENLKGKKLAQASGIFVIPKKFSLKRLEMA